MALHRFAVAVVAIVPLATFVVSQQPQEQRHGMRHEALAKYLGLEDKQKEQIQKICADFDQKEQTVAHELWTLCQQECDALQQILTTEQREKVPAVLKEERVKEREKIAAKLGLNDDQKKRLAQVCDKYDQQFQELVKQKDDKSFNKMLELREHVMSEARPILSEEQRLKLPGILHEEFEMWLNPSVQSEQQRVVADKLGLNDGQRQQAQKIMTDFNQKFEQPRNQLRQLHQQEHAAIEQVLNEQQRSKYQQLVKTHNGK